MLCGCSAANPLNPRVLSEEQLPFLNPFSFPGSSRGILIAFSLAYQTGLMHIGTGKAGIVFVYETSVPVDPWWVLNVVSPTLSTSFDGTALFVFHVPE
jgi:hypothetical protein